MLLYHRAGRALACLCLTLAAACAVPPTPTPVPDTPTPNGVQTALAQLTASFASLTPTASDTPAANATPTPSQTQPATDIPAPTTTASATQTIRVADTPTVVTATPTQTVKVSPAPRGSTLTPTPPITATRGVSTTVTLTATATLTPTAAARIGPSNAMSLTQVTVLGPILISGTQVAKLDEAAWAPDGQLAAVGAVGVLFAQGATLTITHGYTMGLWVPSLSFSTDNRALALSSVGGTVRLFNRADGALLFQLVQPNLRVSQVRYRPGPPGVLAQYLASLGGDNTIYVWDVAYRKFLGTLSPGPGNPEVLEISGDGRWLAAASGNAVWVWDMAALPPNGWTQAPSPTFTLTQAGIVTSLAFSRDGLLLAASNTTGTVELWTLGAEQPPNAFTRVNSDPARLAFSPDGQLLAAAYADQVIRVWSLTAANAPLAELTGHTARITSLAFSPDGTTLASSSWDGTVRLWAVR